MQCPYCSHGFSFRDALRNWNPLRVVCSACGRRSGIGVDGYLIVAACCALGIGAAVYVGGLYQTGEWSLLRASAAIGAVLLLSPLVDWLVLRFASLRRLG